MTSRPATSARGIVPTRWGLIAIGALAYLAIGVVEAVLLRVTSYEAFEIEGPSMEPTLVNGDRVVVDKGAFGLFLPLADEATEHWADPERGDVVILLSPMDDVDIVKRVVAIAGDTIEIRDDEVFVNGASLRIRSLGRCEGEDEDCVVTEEGIGGRRWRTSSSTLLPGSSLSERVVPDGHVFVLGDHRDHSNDSRNPRLGMVPVGRLRGRALVVYWSDVEGRLGTWVE